MTEPLFENKECICPCGRRFHTIDEGRAFCYFCQEEIFGEEKEK